MLLSALVFAKYCKNIKTVKLFLQTEVVQAAI